MKIKEFNVSVSLKDNSAKVIEGIVQYDTGNIINVRIVDGAEPYDFTGYSNIVVEIQDPTGTPSIAQQGEWVNVKDPEVGLISIVIPAQGTVMAGMHNVFIHIFSNGKRVSTSRFNYYVKADDSIDEGTAPEDPQFPILMGLTAQISQILEAEGMREIAERLRQLAEANRASETDGILEQARQVLQEAQRYADTTKDWYDLFMSAAGDIQQVDLSTVVTKTDLAERLKNLDCGTADGVKDVVLQILRGETPPSLKAGELCYTDDGYLWVGLDGGMPAIINSADFIISPTEPMNNKKLWVDSANNYTLKVYDNGEWKGTNTAVFA